MSTVPLSRNPEKEAVDSVEALVGQVADEFTQRLNRGEQPQIEEYTERYPQIAALLRQVLPALQWIRLPAEDVKSPSDPAASHGLLTGCLGDFRIIREIGRGGMGIVYEAEQISLDRRVALKVLPFAATLDPKQLQRFKHEAQAAGHLHHTNIVPVYAVGCERGVHYYAMQLIHGQTLAAVVRELKGNGEGRMTNDERWTNDQCPSPKAPAPGAEAQTDLRHSTFGILSSFDIGHSSFFRTVAQLGVQAAEALEHAHDEGVVHRDIKPANLLVDVKGKLWITDFGLARCRDNVGLTMSGDLLGTVRYMSPEQAFAKRAQVDHRTDIYSLGVTLYELLTLEPAFSSNDRQQLVQQIAVEEPCPPRRINKRIPVELETIVLKAIDKDPEDRYESAQQMAEDLEHFLANKPIRARPARWWERAWKWARRRPALTAVYGLVLLALVLSGLGLGAASLWQRAEAARSQAQIALVKEEQARKGEAEARGHLAIVSYLQKVQLAHHAWLDNDLLRARLLLDNCRPEELRHWEWYHMNRLCHSELRTLQGHTMGVTFVDYTPEGRLISDSIDRTVRVWDPDTGREVRKKEIGDGRLLAWSPDRKRIIIAKTVMVPGQRRVASGELKVEEWRTGREQFALKLDGYAFSSAAVSPDGKRLAAGIDIRDPQTGRTARGEIRLLDLATHQVIHTFKDLGNGVWHLAFSPDSQRLASSSGDKTVKVWDLATAQELLTLKGQNGGEMAFSSDGRRLVTITENGAPKLWDIATGREAVNLSRPPSPISHFAISPDGKRLSGTANDKRILVWDLTTGRGLLGRKGHTGVVTSIAYSPDGRRLVTGSMDKTIKLWDTAAAPEPQTLKVIDDAFGVEGLAFSPDGCQFVTTGHDNKIKFWDTAICREIFHLEGELKSYWAVAFSPDGRHLASSSFDERFIGTVKIWDLTTKRETLTLKGHTAFVAGVAYSPDGRLLATAGFNDKMVKVWDATTGQELFTLGGYSGTIFKLAVSRDGRLLATASEENDVKVWDLGTRRPAMTLKGHTKGVHGVAFSPDGRRLATASNDETVRVWDLNTGQALWKLQGHATGVDDVVFSPDGQRLASGSQEGKVKLWDMATGEEALTLPTGGVTIVAFSPDGRQLAAVLCEGAVKLWSAPSLPKRIATKN